MDLLHRVFPASGPSLLPHPQTASMFTLLSKHTRSSYLAMSTSTALHTEDANLACEQLEAVIEDHAQIANNSLLLMVVHWVVAVLRLLLVFIDSAVSELIARIDDAEESSTSGGAPLAIGDTAATQATAPASSTATA